MRGVSDEGVRTEPWVVVRCPLWGPFAAATATHTPIPPHPQSSRRKPPPAPSLPWMLRARPRPAHVAAGPTQTFTARAYQWLSLAPSTAEPREGSVARVWWGLRRLDCGRGAIGCGWLAVLALPAWLGELGQSDGGGETIRLDCRNSTRPKLKSMRSSRLVTFWLFLLILLQILSSHYILNYIPSIYSDYSNYESTC